MRGGRQDAAFKGKQGKQGKHLWPLCRHDDRTRRDAVAAGVGPRSVPDALRGELHLLPGPLPGSNEHRNNST
jgi:hypothetical protein